MDEIKIDSMPVRASIELGTADIKLSDVKAIGEGSILQMKQLAGEPALIRLNGMPYALGEIVVIDENYGIRVTDLIRENERIKYIDYDKVPYTDVWRNGQH